MCSKLTIKKTERRHWHEIDVIDVIVQWDSNHKGALPSGFCRLKSMVAMQIFKIFYIGEKVNAKKYQGKCEKLSKTYNLPH